AMARKNFVVGNWKMYTTAAAARDLAAAVARGVTDDRITVAVAPPFPWLQLVAETVKGSPVRVCAQDVYPEPEGAFTGEVSTSMLLDAGCRAVIVGHSERRHVIGETDMLINEKARAALKAGLVVVLCVGEKLEERDANKTEAVLDNQLTWGTRDIPANQVSQLAIGYEPVWAIGTGRTATPEQAEQAHVFIRWRLSQIFGEEAVGSLPILYGGSVKPDNVHALMAKPDVDGAMVGGAS